MKKLLCAGIIFVSLSSLPQMAFAAEMIEKPDYRAVVNGVELKNQVYENIDHAHMYPVREMGEFLGYTIEWNGEEKSCLISSETVPDIKFYIGEDKYISDAGTVTELRAVPEIKDGRSYVPSTFFTKFFSLHMQNLPDGTVNITTPVQVTLSDAEENAVAKGTLFSISLEENTSTGYQWTVTHDDNVQLLKTMTDSDISEAPKDSVGVPTTKTWIFKCDEPGEYQIQCTYERSFEENSAAETHIFKVTVA